ncbi:DUF787 family protein [Candidatus Borreliella tachyglossi]|uniref:DUF787 family protein n=1 Tax=Candidatus Borreliella tachyglossi TaxID=1964448 RepID=UPI004041BE4C
MPQDTINVNLIDSAVKPNSISYCSPLLIYKSDVLSEGHLVLNTSSFKENIEELPKAKDLVSEDHQKAKIILEQKTFLATSCSDFFGEAGLGSLSLYIYKDIKNLVAYLEKHAHTFVVFVDKVEETLKSDYEAIKALVQFSVFASKTKELPDFLKKKVASQRDGIIVVYVNDDNLHLKFISKYLHQASIFQSVNPYGITLKGNPIYDANLISALRKDNINFYSLLNETGRDGVLALKEGVDFAGNPIDEVFTYYVLKTEATRELIRIWNRNNRQNSKLSALNIEDGKPNAYTAGLECLFKEFKERGLIVSYGDIKLKIVTTNGLGLNLSIRVKYNDSFKSVVLNISSDDINDYLRGEAAAQ